MALVLYAPALALSQSRVVTMYKSIVYLLFILFKTIIIATGLNIWLSVVSIGLICTFYSSVVRSISSFNERITQCYYT